MRTKRVLPRLAPDQMYALLGVLALVMLPHAWHTPPWLSAVVLAMLGWRAWCVRTQAPMPPRWLLWGILVLLFGGVLSAYHSLLGKGGGVATLTVLIAAKSLEMRTRGDALVLVYLSYFLITTNFLFDQSPPMAVYLFTMVLLVTTLLIGWHSSQGFTAWRDALGQMKLAGVMMLQAIPVMVVLFVFFPRIDGPLWRLPQDRGATRSGLADAMAPGSFSSMLQDDTVAFRVSFDGPRPRQDKLYWRGPVFEDFDGVTWSQWVVPEHQSQHVVRLSGQPVRYHIMLEPHMRNWLLGLDMPITASIDSHVNDHLQLVAAKPVDHRQLVDVTSLLDYRVGLNERPDLLAHDLRLPPTGNPRARQLAEGWRALPPAERIRAALDFFTRQRLLYSLQPPLYGRDGIDQFLFEGRTGFCEHFASAFVFMMRAAGVPARVVGGYQGGEDNGDYLIVRQADAHAWADVWLADQGWVRVDPTFAVDPARIEEGLGSSVPADSLPYLLRADRNWVKQVRLLMDSAVNTWNLWVIGYTPERQKAVLSRLGIDSLVSSRFVAWFGGSVVALVAAIAGWLLWHMRPTPPDRARVLWDRFCTKLARRGLLVGEAEGPRDFAERAAQQLPERAASIRAVLAQYLAVRYGQAGALAELARAVRAFRP